MPKSLDPSSRLTMVLSSDVDKPEKTQPRIFGKTLTLRQQRRLMSLMGKLSTASPDEKIDAALDAAEVFLTGWENMTDVDTGEPIPFNRDSLQDVLSLEELVEVINYVSGSGTTSPADKKKSESQPS